MFLNSTPNEYTPRAFFVVDKSLIDNDVNYYDFQKSKEYQDVYNNVLSSEIQTTDVYVSPYFGKGNGTYRALDRAYEAYKSQIAAGGAAKEITTMPVDMCPDGYYYFMGACVRGLDPVEIAEKATADGCPPGYAFDGERCRPTGLTTPPTTGGGINPALILAAAAAAFFIGG